MSRSVLAVLIAASLAVSLPAPGFSQDPTQRAAEGPVAEPSISGTLFTLAPRAAYTYALVRVVGPHHYEARKVFDRGGALTIDLLADGWLTITTEEAAVEGDPFRSFRPVRRVEQRVAPVALSDGRYHYEAFVGFGDGAPDRLYGTFLVANGAATLEASPVATGLEQGASAQGSLVPERESAVEGPSQEGDSTAEFFEILDGNANGHTRLTMESASGGTIDELWEFINSNGNFFLCETGSGSGGNCDNPTTFLQDVGGAMGIGTQAPAVDVHIVGGNTELRLEDTGDNAVWDLQTLFGEFAIEDGLSGNDVFTLEQGAPGFALLVDTSGEVGLGTSDPEDRLHLVHTDPTIRFTETDGNGSVFRLRVDTVSGNRRFVIQDGDSFQPLLSVDQDTGRVGLGNASLAGAALDIAPREGDAHLRLTSTEGPGWTIDGSSRVMTVSRDGTAGGEFILRDRLDAHGPTLAVAGSVVGTQCINTSSRQIKTGFAAVDTAAVLAKVAELPITTWRYRHEAGGAKHVGPVAEDFQRLFGLGDGETISTVDATGVLMAAVQALAEENRELLLRVEALERNRDSSSR